MILELSLLILSCLAMVALLVHKQRESSQGVRASVENVRAKTDPLLRNVRHTTGRFVSYISVRNGVLFANYVFVHVVRFMMHASHKVHRVSAEVVSRASKKKEDLTRGGAASFYLKKIKEGKEGEALDKK
jgi:hypothetical protein